MSLPALSIQYTLSFFKMNATLASTSLKPSQSKERDVPSQNTTDPSLPSFSSVGAMSSSFPSVPTPFSPSILAVPSKARLLPLYVGMTQTALTYIFCSPDVQSEYNSSIQSVQLEDLRPMGNWIFLSLTISDIELTYLPACFIFSYAASAFSTRLSVSCDSLRDSITLCALSVGARLSSNGCAQTTLAQSIADNNAHHLFHTYLY